MQINRAYGGVGLLVNAISFNYLFQRHYEVEQRNATYSKDILNYSFEEAHNKEVGDDIAGMGYPDNGNGRYTDTVGYGGWYFMNIVKRCHRNDFEHIATVIPLSLFNGLIYPLPTIGLLSSYFVGRKLYSYGYEEKEGAFNKYRIAGSLIVNAVHMITIGGTIFIGYRMIKGSLCLQSALGLAAKAPK